VEIHFIPGDNLASSNGAVTSSTEWSTTLQSCTTNSDNTADCLFTGSFAPALPGNRFASLTVTSAQGNKAYIGLAGVGYGAGATIDPAITSTFGKSLQVAGLASDSNGNIYVADTASKSILRYTATSIAQGSSAAPSTLTTLTAPSAVVADPRGYIYALDSSVGTLTEISPAGVVSTLSTTGDKLVAIAVDNLNDLYIADQTAKSVYQYDPITHVGRTLLISGLVAPSGLVIDPNNNLVITDPGAPAVYRYNLQSGVLSTVTTTATAPAAVTVDAAGNLLIADSASILAKPASANSSAFSVSSLMPAGLAIDGAGNLYTGSSTGSIVKLTRTQANFTYASVTAAAASFNLLSSGSQALQLASISQTDASDYTLAFSTTTDCAMSSSFAGTLASGGACPLTATYTPTTYLTTTDTATFNGNQLNAALSTPASVQLTLTGPAAPPATNTVLQVTPSSPVYGQTLTLTSTVSARDAITSPLVPAGSVTVTIDSTTQVTGTVDSATGIATITAPMLNAGNHQFYSTYTGSNGYTSSVSSTANLTIAQATPTIMWTTPAAITYGTALSATQLNAAASYNSSTMAGTFAYTPALGTVLGVGTQTLSVTFTPTDTVNYATVTQTVQLTVTKVTPAIALVASPNPAMLSNAVTFTATVTAAGGAVPGTVSFYDGTTLLGTATLSAGVGAYTTSSLAVGTHAVTAVYAASANLNTVTSSAISEVVQDFAMTISGSGSPSGTVVPGGSTSFAFYFGSTTGAFAAPLTFSASGLPTGATATFSPATLSAPGTVVMTVAVPLTHANLSKPSGFGRAVLPLALGLLLLPFACKWRRTARRLQTLLVLAIVGLGSLGALIGMTGCGASSGFFGQTPQNYTITVTATSGTLSHSTTVTLTVE
jgi:sugar lactone lactonase YvrE